MAKGLLLNALRKVFADYVVGLTDDKLKLGVWSGNISLADLQVNPDAVNQLGLPVAVSYGTVERFEVHIPWSRLDREPVRVNIKGLFLLVGPVHKESWGDEEVRRRRLGIKRQQLDAAEKQAAEEAAKRRGKGGQDEGNISNEDKGFFEKLVQRIIDNLQVTVEDVHIRYEDPFLVEGATVSAGVTLDSFTIRTADAAYKTTFIDRTRRGAAADVVHKTATIENFAVYWRHNDSQSVAEVAALAHTAGGEGAGSGKGPVAAALGDGIAREAADGTAALERGYLIRPGRLSLRFAQSDSPKDTRGPKYDVAVESFNLQMDIQAEQYEQALALKDAFTALNNWQEFYPYRPRVSVEKDPKAWWKYAYVCVSRRPDRWGKMMKVLFARRDYMALCKRSKLAAAAPKGKQASGATGASDDGPQPLSEAEQQRLDDFEQDLPVESLVIFRRLVDVEISSERRRQGGKKPASGSGGGGGGGGGGWFGWFGGGGGGQGDGAAAEVPEGANVVQMATSDLDDDLKRSVYDAAAKAEKQKARLPPEYIEVRVAAAPQGGLRLFGKGAAPLVEVEMAATAMLTLTHDENIDVGFTLDRLRVKDVFTKGAIFPDMVGAQPVPASGSEGDAAAKELGVASDKLMVVTVLQKPGSLTVMLTARPLIVAYNRECVAAVLSAFSSRAVEVEAAKGTAYKQLVAAQAEAQAFVQRTTTMDVSVDVAAPTIVIPVSSSSDGGCLLLDTGRLSLRGGTQLDGYERPDKKLMWRVALTDIAVRMPSSCRSLGPIGASGEKGQQGPSSDEAGGGAKGGDDALIEPFGVEVGVDTDRVTTEQMTGHTLPEMKVDVTVKPRIRGVLSPSKLELLFLVLDYVTSTDSSGGGEDEGGAPTGLAAPQSAAGAGVQRLGYTQAPSLGAIGEEDGDDDEGNDESSAATAADAAQAQAGEAAAPQRKQAAAEQGKAEEKEAEPARDDPGKVLLVASVSLPSLEMVLVRDATWHEQFHLSLSNLELSLTQRPHDMAVDVRLAAIALEDKNRPETCENRFMVKSEAEDQGDQAGPGLIRVTYLMISDKRSPSWGSAQHDSVADIRFSSLQLYLEDTCLDHIRPFYQALTRQEVDREAAVAGANDTVVELARAANARRGSAAAKAKAHETFNDSDARSVASSVAAFLTGSGAKDNGVVKQGINGGAPTVQAKVRLRSVALDLMRGGGAFEPVLHASVDELVLDASAGSDTNVNLTLGAIVLTDARPAASRNIIKTILAPRWIDDVAAKAPLGSDPEDGDVDPAAASPASASDLHFQSALSALAEDETREGQEGGSSGGGDGNVSLRDFEDAKGAPPPLISVAYRDTGAGGDLKVVLSHFTGTLIVPIVRDSLLLYQQMSVKLFALLGIGGEQPSDAAPQGGPKSGGGGRGEAGDLGLPRSSSRMSSAGRYALEQQPEEEDIDQDSIAKQLSGFAASAFPNRERVMSQASEASAGNKRRRPSRSKKDAKKAGNAAAAAKSSALTVSADLVGARLQLVENAADPRTRVLVMRTTVQATFCRANDGSGDGTNTDKVSLAVVNLESFVDQDVRRHRLKQVLEPFSAQLVFSMLSKEDKIISLESDLEAEAFEARISYSEGMMVTGLVTDLAAIVGVVSTGDHDDAATETSESPAKPDGLLSDLADIHLDEDDEIGYETDGHYDSEGSVTGGAQEESGGSAEPKQVTTVVLRAGWELLRVVLVNDYEGLDVPVLSFFARDMRVDASGLLQDFQAKAHASAEASFFNLRVVRWEPLLEPWTPTLSLQMRDMRKLSARLECDQLLQLNVTSDCMESVLSSYYTLFASERQDLESDDEADATTEEGLDDDEEDDPTAARAAATAAAEGAAVATRSSAGAEVRAGVRKEYKVVVVNETALDLVVRTSDFPDERVMVPGNRATAAAATADGNREGAALARAAAAAAAAPAMALPFAQRQHRSEMAEYDLAGKFVHVGFGGKLGEQREPLTRLPVGSTSRQAYPLVPFEPPPGGSVVADPVVERTWQNERFDAVTRRWRQPYFPHDRPHWSTKDWVSGSSSAVECGERRPEAVQLPEGGGWEWRDDWHVDLSTKEVGKEVDEEGWEYGVDFSGFNLVSRSRTRREFDGARRRCWIRTRAPKPLPLDSPHRPLSLVWQVDVTPQGRLQLRARSTVRIVNHTRLWLEVAALCSAWGDNSAHLKPLRPGQESDVPVLLAYASHYQFRPRRDVEGSEHGGGSRQGTPNLGASGTGKSKKQLVPQGVEAMEEYAWCKPVAAIMNNVDKSRDLWATCLTADAAARAIADESAGGDLVEGETASTTGAPKPPPPPGSIHLVVHLERDGDAGIAIHILPPLVIANQLPCSMRFGVAHNPAVAAGGGAKSGGGSGGGSVRQRSSAGSGSGGSGVFASFVGGGDVVDAKEGDSGEDGASREVEGGDVHAADSVQVTRAFMGSGAVLRLQLPFYDWSQAELCLPTRVEEVRGVGWMGRSTVFKLHDGSGRYLHVQGRFEQVKGPGCPAMHLELFCPLWLSDRTGLSLDFAYDGRKIARPVIPAFNSGAGSSGGSPPASAQLRIDDLKVKRSPPYEVVEEAREGTKLYMDRDYAFGKDSLPPGLQGQPFIRTANDDKHTEGRSFLKFTINVDASVFVLFDMRAETPPTWLPAQGFRKTGLEVDVVTPGVVRATHCPFAAYARVYPAGSTVKLGGNKAPGARTMYLVFVSSSGSVAVPQGFAGLSGGFGAAESELGAAWVRGDRGLFICNPGEKRTLVVCVPNVTKSTAVVVARNRLGSENAPSGPVEAWSKELEVGAGANGVFDVTTPNGRVHELAIRSSVCPGVFSRSTKVTVMPRFVLVNLLHNEPVIVKQQRTDDSMAVEVPPGGRLPWHWPTGNERAVKLRLPSTAWSYARIQLDQVGSTALHLPFFDADEPLEDVSVSGTSRTGSVSNSASASRQSSKYGGFLGSSTAGALGFEGSQADGGGAGNGALSRLLGRPQSVLHVDVKLADEAEGECVVVVLLWRAGGGFDPIYRIANHTRVPLRAYQAVPGADKARRCFEKASYIVPPRRSSQLGWAYPSLPRTLAVQVAGGGGGLGSSRSAELHTDGVGNTTQFETGLPPGSGPAVIYGEVAVVGGTKVLRFSDEPPSLDEGDVTVSARGAARARRPRKHRRKKEEAIAAAAQAAAAQKMQEDERKRRVSLASKKKGKPTQQQQQQKDGAAGGGDNDDEEEEAAAKLVEGEAEGMEAGNLVVRAASELEREMEDPDVQLEVELSGIGVSLIGKIPGGSGAHAKEQRMELLYMQLSLCKLVLKTTTRHNSVELSAGDLQLDNHVPAALYPVVLGQTRADPAAPAVTAVSVRQRDKSTNTTHYEYAAFRLLEMDVQNDRASAFRLRDVLAPVQSYLSLAAQKQSARLWLSNETAEALSRRRDAVPGGFCDIDLIRRGAREVRRYFKSLIVHPIFLHLSWAPTSLAPGQEVPPYAQLVGALPSIPRSNIGLASYIVDDAFGAINDLRRHILAFYAVQATTQVLRLVGSVRALGSPADLVSNVGTGAKALFYEPLKGLVHSPSEFFSAVGKGAGTFGRATVHGVFNSMAGVVSGGSNLLSRLALDDEYERARERRNMDAMSRGGGVRQGLRQGGQNVVGGIVSGVTGIFTRPARQAKREGVGGFVKGVGQGLVGAVVKPVVGLSDGFASIMQGVSNSAGDAQQHRHLRPRRALEVQPETGLAVLTPYSEEAAHAQELVLSQSNGRDRYMHYVAIADIIIIFSRERLTVYKRQPPEQQPDAQQQQQSQQQQRRRSSGGGSDPNSDGSAAAPPKFLVWKRWEEIAYVEVSDMAVVLRTFEGDDVTLRCHDRPTQRELYRQLLAHARDMGDPGHVVPLEEAFGELEEHPLDEVERRSSKFSTMKAHSSAITQSIDSYRFGVVNGKFVAKRSMSDRQIVEEAQEALKLIGVGNWPRLDEIAWEMVAHWDHNHGGLSASRCLVVTFINASSSTVPLGEMFKKDGFGYRLLAGPQMDVAARQLLPGGVCILFAWGHVPGVLKRGNVQILVDGPAFSAFLALQKPKVKIASKGRFKVGFVEKTITDWWGKQVVVIK